MARLFRNCHKYQNVEPNIELKKLSLLLVHFRVVYQVKSALYLTSDVKCIESIQGAWYHFQSLLGVIYLWCKPICCVACKPICCAVCKPICCVVCKLICCVVCKPICCVVYKPICCAVCKPICCVVCKPICCAVCKPIFCVVFKSICCVACKPICCAVCKFICWWLLYCSALLPFINPLV